MPEQDYCSDCGLHLDDCQCAVMPTCPTCGEDKAYEIPICLRCGAEDPPAIPAITVSRGMSRSIGWTAKPGLSGGYQIFADGALCGVFLDKQDWYVVRARNGFWALNLSAVTGSTGVILALRMGR